MGTLGRVPRHRDHTPAPGRESAAQAAGEAAGTRRVEAATQELLDRLDGPIAKATKLTTRTLAWFPVRVWRLFLQRNGFLLAAGLSYQSLFAFFATLYVAFAIAGLSFGSHSEAIDRLVDLVNGYIPGLIADDGMVTRDQLNAIVDRSTSLLGVTGGIAVLVLGWTAIGFVTFARRAVRDIFGLPFDARGYVRLKALDLLAAVIFGVALVIASILGSAASGIFDVLLRAFGAAEDTVLAHLTVRILSLAVGFVVNSAAIAALVRFLTGTSLPWRVIVPGAAAGGLATSILQIGAGLLLSYTPSNPLLATFAVFIGLLLWFRLNGIVILVAAAWIATVATDRDLALRELSAQEREQAEREAMLLAAQVRVREARLELDRARGLGRWASARRLRRAEEELAEAQSRRSRPSSSPSR